MSSKQQLESCKENEKSAVKQAIDKTMDFPPVKMATKALKAVGDETFFNWLAHGSTELANMVLHGHAAPVYSHGFSPAQDTPLEQQPAQPAGNDVVQDQAISPGSANVLDKYFPDRGDVAATQEQTMVTSHGVSDSKSVGIVEQHMQDVAAMPNLQTPEQELSRC